MQHEHQYDSPNISPQAAFVWKPKILKEILDDAKDTWMLIGQNL